MHNNNLLIIVFAFLKNRLVVDFESNYIYFRNNLNLGFFLITLDLMDLRILEKIFDRIVKDSEVSIRNK